MALINKALLAAYSPLPVNYNFEEIMLYQPIAISIWVKPLLGEAFTEEIEYQVEKNKVSPENSTLMTTGGLLQYLSYAMVYEGLPFIWSHFSEAGITVAETDFSKSITLKDITYIQDHLRRTLELLKDNLIKFLNTHCKSYPLYCPTNCGCNDSCCNTDKGLSVPNPNWQVFSLKKKNTDLR